MTESPHGLVRTIGRWSLTALIVNSIIGGGIFGLPSLLAAKLGGLSPIAYLFAAAGILTVAGCIAEVSSRYEETGGLYLYARDALGRFVGLLVAWLTWLTRIAAPAAVANLFCTYLAQFSPLAGTPGGKLLVLAVLLGHLAFFNYVGVKSGKNLSNFFTAAKVGFLLFFVATGLLALIFRPEIRVPLTVPTLTAANCFQAVLLLVYAYGGFEGALFVGGESTNPRRDTPIALLLALAAVTVIYTAVQFVTVATLPGAVASSRPLSDAAQHFLGPAGAVAMALAALVSSYGYLSANLLHSPRITFAMAEQGDFPAFLAAIHPKYRTPYFSILLYALIVFVFAVLGNFQWNAMLSAASRLAIYGAMAIAVPVLRRRNDGKAQFRLPAANLFAALALLFSVVLLTQMGKGEFYVVGTTCAIALLNWIFVRR
ncbi:MAG TPA: APC family permease [Candidatus Acidoferrales bacterium]|nr:APC family permease [Candidatus Acidoferrales bacterium]